jgi:hypothetical protein
MGKHFLRLDTAPRGGELEGAAPGDEAELVQRQRSVRWLQLVAATASFRSERSRMTPDGPGGLNC